ncbi:MULTISPECIES: hypothetical protein [unclassified Streptomyces]|uniref:hypothetical protein n=1 Tax=unclassified Streptomyces TaxID=2593676 RepID=UPI003D926856
MPEKRKYTLSPEALAARSKGGKAVHATLDAYVKRIVDRAPELTDEQIEMLRPLLRPVSGGAAE